MILNIIQVYAPAANSTEEQLIEFYNDVQKAISMCKSQQLKVFMDDLNAKVGCGQVDNIVGPFGLGTENERGEKFKEFCLEKYLVIANTWFKQHSRRLWSACKQSN